MLRLLPILLPGLLALSACGAGKGADDPAPPLENGAATANDPALRAALREPIMVDPMLAGRANADAIRPPVEPYSANIPPDGIADTGKPPETDRLQSAPSAKGACPQCAAARRALTLGALAEVQGPPFSRCAEAVSYSAGWANRLPAAVPLYPKANLSEAAGADGPACTLRIVSFRTNAKPQRLLDWYYTKTRIAGFSAQHHANSDEHALAGTRADGGAFLLLVRPNANGGSEADLVVDAGA